MLQASSITCTTMNKSRPPPTRSEKKPAKVEPGYFPDVTIIHAALEAATVGIWSWDIHTDRVIWSSNLEDIHRLPRGSFDGTFAFVQNAVHPEDRAAFLLFIKDAMREREPRRGLYRLPPKPDEEERWIEVLASVRLQDGEVAGMIGTCRDVTERVRLHRELRIRANQQEAVAR